MCAGVAFWAGQAAPQSPAKGKSARPPAAVKTAELDAAAPLYRRMCQSCHGRDGRAAGLRRRRSPIPDFTDIVWQNSRSDAQLAAGILDGRGDEMPPFHDSLNAAQTRAMVALVRAFAPAAVRAASADVADDFEARFRELQRELDGLKREFRKLSDKGREP